MPAPEFEEILRPRKGKWALILLVFTVMPFGGYLMITRPHEPHDRLWGYAGIAFCAVGIIVSLIQLFPGSSFLRLTAEGFTIRTLWRTSFFRWSDIERFGVAELNIPQPRRMVGLDFSSSYPRHDKSKTLKTFNRGLTGFEGALPDNYGWDHDKLAAHLNELRARYAGK